MNITTELVKTILKMHALKMFPDVNAVWKHWQ